MKVWVLSQHVRQLKVELCGQKYNYVKKSKISIYRSTHVLNIATNNFILWWASEKLGKKEREK